MSKSLNMNFVNCALLVVVLVLVVRCCMNKQHFTSLEQLHRSEHSRHEISARHLKELSKRNKEGIEFLLGKTKVFEAAFGRLKEKITSENEGSECVDAQGRELRKWCSERKKKGQCNHPSLEQYTKTRCRKTCGFCD